MGKGLTAKQRQILDFIRSHINNYSAPPTIREIGTHFKISSTNGVRCHLTALENKGYIRRTSYRSRGIEMAEKSHTPASLTSIPILGRVAAGYPILAEENLEGRIGIDSDLLSGDELFALKVTGDSMTEAGIFDGDLVFARKQQVAERGEIVVAIIGDDATVKYYHPDNNRARLEPANPSFRTVVVERDTPGFHIAGKVVGVFRKYH
ncbi:MAG: transcriptional repressor LexA [FCB group bacterium]|nr:transcriptional repressor LexA [FCB group bacterium]